MATYYRWRKSYAEYALDVGYPQDVTIIGYGSFPFTLYYSTDIRITGNGYLSLSGEVNSIEVTGPMSLKDLGDTAFYFAIRKSNSIDSGEVSYGVANLLRIGYAVLSSNYQFQLRAIDSGARVVSYVHSEASPGDFIEYLYSTDGSEYQTGVVNHIYYYDQKTTITSPTEPANLTHPNPVTTPTVEVSWTAATSNVPSYAVNLYELSYQVNGSGSWTVAGTTSGTSMQVTLPTSATSVQFRVRAKDSNGQWGEYQTGSAVAVYLTPNLTAPNLAMQGQNITINWTESLGATGYIVQRKSNTDGDWVQVYSGGALTFTEAVGPWSSVQYRVQAVFSGGTSGWATSAAIQVVSSSSLVISGQNGDLGTLVNDVPYTISTDTGNQITVKTTVNGAVIFDSTVPSGAAEFIPVLDLVHGTGTIVIEASVQASNGTVSAVRSWTYNKAAMTFPNAGCPSQLERNGKNIWPKTLAECVRLPGGRTLEEVTTFPAQAFYTSYTGTGTSGSGNQTHLAVPFKPQALAILDGNTGDAVLMVRPGTKVMNGNTSLTVAWSDTGVSWYSTNASNQLNATGTAYHVVVFG